MIDDPELRRELGNFIRSCRERLAPEAIGLPAGGRRRTPGLRREEVAQLSGLSATWYTWLEQGRDISVSASALARLAGALRLTRAERTYLFELAARRDPGRGSTEPPGLPAMLDACVGVIDAPAYVLDRAWNARAWNRRAERLFVGWLDRGATANLLRYIFLGDDARRLIRDYDARARRVVSEFRADAGAKPDNASARALVDELAGRSPLFARLWEEHSVVGREGGERSFDHPEDGLVVFQQVTFDVAAHDGLKLTILVPRPAAA